MDSKRYINLDALNPGVGGGRELGNCCLLLNCLSVNRSQRSLGREIYQICDWVKTVKRQIVKDKPTWSEG